jgi:YMGG-like Gly-zipper
MASVTIPAGTTVTVRMIDSIDTDVTGAGERFRASIDDPIVVNGQVVVPRNADATVQVMRVEQSGRISGSDEIALKLYDVTIDGKPYEVASEYAEVKGEGQGKKTAKTTAVTTGVGAALGAIFGGGKGAAIGAGAGAATGVAVSAARGKTLRIPSETRLEFELRAPLPVK